MGAKWNGGEERALKLETVKIPGETADGKVELAALRYLPETKVQDTVLVFAHGFTSGKYSLDALASYLAGRGYEGLTFDFVGHKLGATGGELRFMAQIPENLLLTLRWMQAHSSASKIVLVGHSMGGAAALIVGSQESADSRSRLAGIACLCIGINPSHGFHGLIGRTMLTQRADYISGSPAEQLITELDSLVLAARDLPPTLPTLFIAARQDVLVPVSRVEALAALAPHAEIAILDTSHPRSAGSGPRHAPRLAQKKRGVRSGAKKVPLMTARGSR